MAIKVVFKPVTMLQLMGRRENALRLGGDSGESHSSARSPSDCATESPEELIEDLIVLVRAYLKLQGGEPSVHSDGTRSLESARKQAAPQPQSVQEDVTCVMVAWAVGISGLWDLP